MNYITCSDMSYALSQPTNLNQTDPFPNIQTATRNLGVLFAAYPFLEAMMQAISDNIQQRGSRIQVKSPINKDIITRGSVGINTFFSSRSVFTQPYLKLKTQIDFSCSTRGNLLTQRAYYFLSPLSWASFGSSDPFSIDFKVIELPSRYPARNHPNQLLHVHCKSDRLPELTCTSSLTKKMREFYPKSYLSTTPRQEEFRLIDPHEKERPVDIIFLKAMISNVLKKLRKKTPAKS